MDKTQRYFTQTIVGMPQRLVLGQQVRFDNDPTIPGSDQPDKPDHWLSRVNSAFTRSQVDATESELQSFDLPGVQPPVASARGRAIRIALLSLPVVAAVVVIGNLTSGWVAEYKQQLQSVQADAGSPSTTEQTPNTTTQASALPLSGASSTRAPEGLGAITLMDEPANIPHDGTHPSASNQVIASAIIAPPVAAVVVAPPAKVAPPVKVAPTPVPKQIVEQAKQEVKPVPVKVLPLPIQQPPADLKKDTETNAAAKVAQNAASPAPTKGTEAPKEEERKSAVVMDTPKPIPEVKPAVAAPVTKAPDDTQAPVIRRFSTPMEIKPGGQNAAPTTTAKPTEGAEPSKADAAGKPAARRVTVVDISPDGSYALVTNPETRLPQKFKTGDKIFTGETIQKIEPKSGKLVLDSRNVYME